MSKKELGKLDLRMDWDYGVRLLSVYVSGDGNTIRVYANDSQRFLVEIDGDKWAIFTHHQSGGPT